MEKGNLAIGIWHLGIRELGGERSRLVSGRRESNWSHAHAQGWKCGMRWRRWPERAALRDKLANIAVDLSMMQEQGSREPFSARSRLSVALWATPALQRLGPLTCRGKPLCAASRRRLDSRRHQHQAPPAAAKSIQLFERGFQELHPDPRIQGQDLGTPILDDIPHAIPHNHGTRAAWRWMVLDWRPQSVSVSAPTSAGPVDRPSLPAR